MKSTPKLIALRRSAEDSSWLTFLLVFLPEAGGGTRAYSFSQKQRNDTVLWLESMKSSGVWPPRAPRAAAEGPKREVDARSTPHIQRTRYKVQPRCTSASDSRLGE